MMKLKVLTENIRLVPSVCKELDGEFALVFRQPTQADAIHFAAIQKVTDILGVMCELFVEFENKPELEDENGKKIEYDTLQEFLSFNNGVIASVTSDLVVEFKRIREQIFSIEKK